MGRHSRKTDKECARTAVAAVLVANGDQQIAEKLIDRNLTTDELVRAEAYLESGKKITGD
ncbi:hypothetical protein [Streptomyces sp. CBMA152]|uniref:hypothetical protein n=1 Tax=Streptomyces sp. CBMA152 TaxID=1896312 RepID=UPI00166129DF|nr:hypothetical protein [Streptomyces sp. CBMA152]MBD0743560.1 hypothetical protein [Streptomyces sp. CBMA152]